MSSLFSSVAGVVGVADAARRVLWWGCLELFLTYYLVALNQLYKYVRFLTTKSLLIRIFLLKKLR